MDDMVYLADALALVRQIRDMPNCNSCGVKGCKFRPEWGMPVRYNCPLYAEGDKGDKDD